MSMFPIDLCPRCGCNNAPLCWLGEDKGWLCEDCFEKEQEAHDNETKAKPTKGGHL